MRIARYYYQLGLTQQEIASELGIGRARVIKLLAEARERGVVTISINSPLLENLELADALAARFGLASAEVCLVQTGDEKRLAQQLARAAGERLLKRVQNNSTLSVGWGITLKELATQLPHFPTNNTSVVSLIGSLTRKSSAAIFEATTLLAERLDAECHYLAAPIVCDSRDTREVLVSQPMFQDLRTMALASELAIVSIGGLDSATIRQAGMVTDEEYESVKLAGAIGNFLGYYIDTSGAIVDHPLNQRIIGVSGDEFKQIPQRLMISGGPSKVEALRAVLAQGWMTDLVTDSQTASALLQTKDKHD